MGILVTGGAGYIGGHMVLGLLDAGEKVVVVDNLSTGFRWAVPAEALRWSSAISVIRSVDVAGHRRASRSMRSPISRQRLWFPTRLTTRLGYYLNNTANARSLIECAVNGGVKQFIFLLHRCSLWGNLVRAR